jgi:hypothetical protein
MVDLTQGIRAHVGRDVRDAGRELRVGASTMEDNQSMAALEDFAGNMEASGYRINDNNCVIRFIGLGLAHRCGRIFGGTSKMAVA